MNIPLFYQPGLPVQVSSRLPMSETYPTCDIETREMQNIVTGGTTHCFIMGNVIYVSQSLYDQLKLQAVKTTSTTFTGLNLDATWVTKRGSDYVDLAKRGPDYID
ncbi:hypothetical protein [Spirosoma sp.]|uniref:hypothetical protein n=1 Tax=Spirosoma sp. TaxID=1899569 RepID=UPI00261B5851|nr:hypothetical protein [Spirosoma sp.]MCX6217617.1 hypothetical protein [Spirosoma sp.]